jgi:hypothetical protein
MHPGRICTLSKGDNKSYQRLGKGVTKGHDGIGGSLAFSYKVFLKIALACGRGKS